MSEAQLLETIARLEKRLSAVENKGALAGAFGPRGATTNTVLDAVRLERTTSGTAADGIGVGIPLFVQDASGNVDEVGRIDAVLTTAAHATQAGMLYFGVLGVNRLRVSSANVVEKWDGASWIDVGSGGHTFDHIHVTNDSDISGLTVGKGGGADASNTVLGAGAFADNTTGYYNTAIGVDALHANTTADNNTALGYDALLSNTEGVANVAVGKQALRGNTLGENNVAVGSWSLYTNTIGNNNVAVGDLSLYSNTFGESNVAVGSQALEANTEASYCVAVGAGALHLNTTGSDNTALGSYALNHNLTGNSNVAVGHDSLHNATGTGNVGAGAMAGSSLTTGSQNTFVGNGAGNHASQKVDAANSMALGNGAYTTADNQVVIGDSSITDTQLRAVTANGNTVLGSADTNTITCTGRLIPRTTASDPQHATAGSRPAGSVGEIAYYSGKWYGCVNSATPVWEKLTSA